MYSPLPPSHTPSNQWNNFVCFSDNVTNIFGIAMTFFRGLFCLLTRNNTTLRVSLVKEERGDLKSQLPAPRKLRNSWERENHEGEKNVLSFCLVSDYFVLSQIEKGTWGYSAKRKATVTSEHFNIRFKSFIKCLSDACDGTTALKNLKAFRKALAKCQSEKFSNSFSFLSHKTFKTTRELYLCGIVLR